jgi:hypothetical protein
VSIYFFIWTSQPVGDQIIMARFGLKCPKASIREWHPVQIQSQNEDGNHRKAVLSVE